MKRIIYLFFCVMFLTGCAKMSKVEIEKNNYLSIKSNLESSVYFEDGVSLPCDISISSVRVDDDNVKYIVNLSNKKNTMDNVKILVIHNGITNDRYPSVGVMDDDFLSFSLDGVASIEGIIETEKNITDLELEFKIWVSYVDDSNVIKEFYYKTTI